MKKVLLIGSLAALTLISCKRKHTCVCTETYKGENDNYEVKTDTTFEDMKTDEARDNCNARDWGPQTVLSETWGTDCELK